MFTDDVIDPFEIMKLMLFWVKDLLEMGNVKFSNTCGWQMLKCMIRVKALRKNRKFTVLPPQQSTTF